MNALQSRTELTNVDTSLNSKTNTVFVANNKGFATVAYDPSGASDCELYDLPHLPGALVVPKSLFGIDHALFRDTEKLQSVAGAGNLNGYVRQLMHHLSSNAQPTSAKEQLAYVRQEAERAATIARGTFEETNDIIYSTDRRSIFMGERLLGKFHVSRKCYDGYIHCFG